jgi:hypothetical protein
VRARSILLAVSLALVLASCGDDDDPTPTASPSETAAPTAEATADTEPAITIDAPADGATVQVPFEASGTANVFEAALTIDVLGNAAGSVLCQRHIMASSGSGTRGTWAATLAFPPPEVDSPATFRAYSFSARDGAMENVVERAIVVSAERPNIVIESPSCNDEVAEGSTLTVSGMAQVFEAQLRVEIRDAAGTALLTQDVLAASGVEYSPWTATFDLSSAPVGVGFYDVVAFSHSAMDGSVINEFPVPIIVTSP